MSSSKVIKFQDVLELIEELPEYQQEDLINIIKRRQIERRREPIAENIKTAKDEYNRGLVKQGNLSDLMNELEE